MGITQCERNARVSFWCHYRAKSISFHLYEYQLPEVKGGFTILNRKIGRVLDECKHFKAEFFFMDLGLLK